MNAQRPRSERGHNEVGIGPNCRGILRIRKDGEYSGVWTYEVVSEA